MVMDKLAAELEQMRSFQPAEGIAIVIIVTVPQAVARILRVDVDRNQRLRGFAADFQALRSVPEAAARRRRADTATGSACN